MAPLIIPFYIVVFAAFFKLGIAHSRQTRLSRILGFSSQRLRGLIDRPVQRLVGVNRIQQSAAMYRLSIGTFGPASLGHALASLIYTDATASPATMNRPSYCIAQTHIAREETSRCDATSALSHATIIINTGIAGLLGGNDHGIPRHGNLSPRLARIILLFHHHHHEILAVAAIDIVVVIPRRQKR